MINIIYFFGAMFSGSTYIRTIVSYISRSERALKGKGDKKNGDGSLCEKTINYSPVNWIPEKLVNKIDKFENIHISNSHFMEHLDINNTKDNNANLMEILSLNSTNEYNSIKIQIIRNPLDSVISRYLYQNKNNLDKFHDIDSNNIDFLDEHFDYYFSQKKKFEDFPISKYYNISYKKFMGKNTQKEELLKISNIIGIENEQFIENYITNDYEYISTHIKNEYMKIRKISNTNSSNIKFLKEEVLTSYFYILFNNKIDKYIKKYDLTDETIACIINEYI